jgi:hypothetical protein
MPGKVRTGIARRSSPVIRIEDAKPAPPTIGGVCVCNSRTEVRFATFAVFAVKGVLIVKSRFTPSIGTPTSAAAGPRPQRSHSPAGAIGGNAGSPIPPGSSVLGVRYTSIGGASFIRTGPYPSKFVCSTAPFLIVISLFSAALNPKNNGALRLRTHRLRIHNLSAIHRGHNATDLELATLDRHFRHFRKVAPNDAYAAMPRPLAFGSGLPHPLFSAASSSDRAKPPPSRFVGQIRWVAHQQRRRNRNATRR